MTHRAFLFYFTFLLTIFEQICMTHMSFQDNGSIQGTKEVHLFSEDAHKEFSMSGSNVIQNLDNRNSKVFLKFEPDILDFKQRILGVPYHEKVTVINVNNNKTIVMSSISGNTVHFHSSFFEDKVIPPKGNTTFNVVFLGRQEGAIESILLIHTSEGSVKYKVKGMSAANPYRLRPLVDIRLPLNASFSPLIYMHNPHSTAIQITEVYSSGGEFHLELPTGELEGPKQMWEIPPYQTRPVIRVRFNARTEANHTAYIRIKLNKSEEVLVVPLEVEVGTFPGLHASQGGIEFGIGGSLDPPKKVKLLLHNTWKKAIRIHSIVTRPNNNVISIDFQPIKIPPLGKTPTLAAYLTINWKSAYDFKQFFGQIIVKSKQIPYDMIIPYWATIYPGGLVYNSSVAQYLSDKRSLDLTPRNFPVTNFFNLPVAVINVTLPSEAKSYFLIQNFQPLVMQPNKTVNLFNLKCIQNNVAEFHFESNIIIYTNISTIKVPLLSYNGKLKKIIPFVDPNETVLDLGLVGNENMKESYLIFANKNPVEVNLRKWSTDLKNSELSLVGCNSGNITEAIMNYAFENLHPCKSIKPSEYAVFLLSLKAPSMEGQVLGELSVETTFERISIPVTIRTASGKLSIEPERIIFDECFPNTVCKQVLRIHSTFSKGMNFLRLNSLPFDPRFSYELPNKTVEDSLHISPRISRVVAHLYFDPSLTCAPYCYTGFTLNSTVGTQWLKTFTLLHSTLEFDLKLLNTMYGRYLNITAKGLSRWQNLTLRLDTTEVKDFIFNTRVKITWPRLLSNSSSENKSFLMFPTTQIGNVSTQTLTFHNPSSYPIVLHLVMEAVYPGGRKLYEQLPNGFKRIYPNTSGVSSTTFYFDVEQLRETSNFAQTHNVSKHSDSVLFVLDADKTIDVTIHFNATSPALKSTLLYIRNNLTVIEVVRLVGQGAYPVLKFGNRKPGSLTPLMFELSDKHLKDCEKERLRKNPSPNLTVKRSFTARNVGDVSIYVKGFYINGYACEGFGFKVLNCEPFNLPPNETKKVDIAFTPDFTLAKIQRTLVLDTSLSIQVNYTLITTVPPYFLAPCSTVLGRPSWENLLYYISISFMFFLLLCVLTGAFLESDRIIQTTVTILTRDPFTMQQPLDLRLIGTTIKHKPDNIQSEAETKCVHHSTPTVCYKNSINEKDFINSASSSHHVKNNNNSSNLIMNDSSPIVKNRKSVVLSSNNLSYNKNNKRKVVKKVSNEPPPPPVSVPVPVPPPEVQKENKELNNKKADLPEKVVITNIIRNKTNTSPVNVTINRKIKIEEPVNNNKKEQKTTQVKKQLTKKKTIDVPCSEEDTSSTTTEYSNNEEGDKENLTSVIKNDKNRKFITKKLKVNDYRDSYEGDDEDNEKKVVSTTHHHQWKIRSSESKSASLNKTNYENSTTIQTNENHHIKLDKEPLQHKRSSNRNNNRDKKEKTVPKKQRVIIDKHHHHINGKLNTILPSETSKYVNTLRPTSTIPPTNCWGETRARFSDVVAGGDTSTNTLKEIKNITDQSTSLFSFDHIRPPTETVENNTLQHTQLGPIGSKKSPVNIWESVPNTSGNVVVPASSSGSSNIKPISNNIVDHPPPVIQQNNDSFFANNFLESSSVARQSLDSSGLVGATTSTNNPLNYTNDIWDTHTSAAMINMLQSSARSMLGDYSSHHVNYQNNWTGNSSLWGDNTFLPPPVGEERQQLFQQQQHLIGGIGMGTGSLWNASPWAPATTIAPDTPTRTPPGFPARPPQRDDEIDRELTFDPFRSLSNIWSPRAPPSS